MAKRVTTKTVATIPQRYCGDCFHAIEDKKFINTNLKGEYFCIRCPFYEEGKFVRLKTWKACNKFRHK